MAQEGLYFPHDYAPFDDIKFEAFVIKHGVTGYGVFWRLVEMLHSNADHLLELEPYVYTSVGARLSVSAQQVESIIEDCISKYQLFQSNNGLFWSDRVFKNIETRKKISKQKSDAGRASAEKRKKDKDIACNFNTCSTAVDEC